MPKLPKMKFYLTEFIKKAKTTEKKQTFKTLKFMKIQKTNRFKLF